MGREAEHAEVVFGVAFVELLQAGLSGMRVGEHEDSGVGAVDAALPAPLGALDAAVGVQLGRRLAEVPDVSGLVLGIPVLSLLAQPSAQEEPVADDRAADSLDL